MIDPVRMDVEALLGDLERARGAYDERLRRAVDSYSLRQAYENKREEVIRALVGMIRTTDVLQAVADHHHVTVEDLRGPVRSAGLVRARRAAAWLLHEQGLSSVEIGKRLDRDHTTILAGFAAPKDEDELEALRALLKRGVRA